MITAVIDDRLEIRVPAIVLGSAGEELQIEAILDTGFNGALTLPMSVISALGLPWWLQDVLVLANGQIEEVDVYAATILWDGLEMDILVQAMESDSLLGMELLLGYDLRARIDVGGGVEIERSV